MKKYIFSICYILLQTLGTAYAQDDFAKIFPNYKLESGKIISIGYLKGRRVLQLLKGPIITTLNESEDIQKIVESPNRSIILLLIIKKKDVIHDPKMDAPTASYEYCCLAVIRELHNGNVSFQRILNLTGLGKGGWISDIEKVSDDGFGFVSVSYKSSNTTPYLVDVRSEKLRLFNQE